MTPNFELAATTAMRALIANNITTAPVMPLPILKKVPGVLVLSFEEMSRDTGIERQEILKRFGENQDAATFYRNSGKIRYIVAYNQSLSTYLAQRAIARELGHIVLGHDGETRTTENRMAEAYCFAHHLLCPRPVIKAFQDAGIPLTYEVLGSVTGCYERCLSGIRTEPGVHVDPELNRKVKEQFSDYLRNMIDFQQILSRSDQSAPADFGHYMDNYEE